MYDIILGRNKEDQKKYGTEATILVGKHYVKMGRITSLSNKIFMDVAKSHVVFIAGKRGSGKCLTGDSLIRLANGSQVPIKELEKNKEKVLSLNNNLKIEEATKTEFFSRYAEKLLKIKLRSGKEIKLTPEHPLFTIKGWKEAQDLNIGIRIATPKKLPALGQKEISFKIRNPNLDTIPKEIWEFFKPKNWEEVGRQIGYKRPKAMGERVDCSPSRQMLLQIAKVEQHKGLKLLAESDIFWDEIVSMELMEGKFKVYDICVPENHNFIANDIIVHNSYTMGVIAESMLDLPQEIKKNLSIIMLDTMGIYWTMKYPNKQDKGLLKEWGIEAKPLNVNIFTPIGYYKKFKEEGIPTDFPFSIKTSELSAYEWSETFGIELNNPIGALIERTIETLKESDKDYDIDDIIGAVQKDDRSAKEVKEAVENRFLSARHWGLFSKQGTLMEDLVIPGQITVLDVSCYAYIPGAQGLRALVIGLVSQKLFTERMIARKTEEYESIYSETHLIEQEEKKREPLIWMVIDEAHEFLPNKGKTVASQPLITVLREGRQPGLSLVLATQQPGKIHTDVITQADVVIAHRLTAKIDTQALGTIMQSYMREGLDKQLNYLPRVKGAAVIFDDINEKIYPMRVRPRYTWHGGATPSIVMKKKKIFEI
jgi:hypothetical protein|tara:strand:- start:665 stop:2620 length:1956 start_codon:yes stop_codon:yes gene_type:complete